jgi:hypothetical protein
MPAWFLDRAHLDVSSVQSTLASAVDREPALERHDSKQGLQNVSHICCARDDLGTTR